MTSTTKHYTAFGRVIASRSGAVGSGGTLRYLLADHLGSTTGQVNAADGTVASQTAYWPFGAERSGTAPERGMRDDCTGATMAAPQLRRPHWELHGNDMT